MCSGGEEKRKAEWVNGWWGKKKKEMGIGVYVYSGKKGGVEKKEEKIFEKEKNSIGFICIFVLFGTKCRIMKIYLNDVYNIYLS